MNKKDMVKAAKKGWPNVNDMVNNLIREMNVAIVNRESIVIHNAFRIDVFETKPNVGHDFKTGQRIKIPSRLKAKITLSPKINRILNERNFVKGSVSS